MSFRSFRNSSKKALNLSDRPSDKEVVKGRASRLWKDPDILMNPHINEAQTYPQVELSAGERDRILVVDDEESIRALLEECLTLAGYDIREAKTAPEALDILSSLRFDLVISDVRMPGMSGLELLATINQRHETVGVLMMTACEDISMAVNAMKLGALDYVLKPFRLEDITSTVRKALHQHAQKMKEQRYLLQLEQVVKEQTLKLRQTFEHLHNASEITLEALTSALDARERETHAHSKRVSQYTVHLARVMGVDETLLHDIWRGAILHDIGKIGVSDNILLKPGKLSEGEWIEMRKHPQIGYWILDGIEGLKPASEIVLAHQEKFDGSGYPRQLRGEQITLGARIFSVIDCFDAMTSDRPYRRATSYAAAREELIRCSGMQFDPLVVKYFLKVSPQKWEEVCRSSVDHKRIPLCPSHLPINP